MKSIFSRLWASVLAGYVLMYFGELVFWATPDRDGMTVVGLLLTWAAYSLFAHVFLAVVGFFRARDGWSVFLAGSVFGWFEEGIVLQTTYGSPDGPFPMSIPFTALAWHALLDVGVGWFLVRRAFSSRSWAGTAGLAAAIGAFYGLWAIFWWNEPPPPMKALFDAGRSDLILGRFAVYALATTAVLIPVHGLARRYDPTAKAPGRWEMGILGASTLLYFGLVTVPAAPKALWVMPPLMGVTLWALNRNRLAEPESARAAGAAGNGSRPGLARPLLLLLIPLVAIAVYAVALATGIRPRTNLFVYYAFSAVGTGLWLAGLAVVAGRRRRGSGGDSVPTAIGSSAR